MSTFVCKVCGLGHEGVFDSPPDIAPTPEVVAKLKADWLAAETKLDKAPTNEHFEKATQKAWLTYAAAAWPRSNVERLPSTVTTRRDRDGFYFVCTSHDEKEKPPEKPRVELKEATTGFLWSTQSVRSSVLVPAGVYVLLASHTFLLVEVKENGVARTVRACENGEEWVDIEVGAQIQSVIVKTHWGPTPFGLALKPATEARPQLQAWVPPPRCHICNAYVHPDRRAGHWQYNCKPGLHQPPDPLRKLAHEAVEASAQRNAELEAMSPEDREKAIGAWAKKLADDVANMND